MTIQDKAAKDAVLPHGQWLTVRELSETLRKSPSAIHKLWPVWAVRYGLRPARFGGSRRGRLLFDRIEIERMLEEWRIAASNLNRT